MKGTLTLSHYNSRLDIPTYDVDTRSELIELIKSWLQPKEKYVYVCFNSVKDESYENEHPTFFVTKAKEDILDFLYIVFRGKEDMTEINFNIFECPTFEEAFGYCTDLKEGL